MAGERFLVAVPESCTLTLRVLDGSAQRPGELTCWVPAASKGRAHPLAT